MIAFLPAPKCGQQMDLLFRRSKPKNFSVYSAPVPFANPGCRRLPALRAASHDHIAVAFISQLQNQFVIYLDGHSFYPFCRFQALVRFQRLSSSMYSDCACRRCCSAVQSPAMPLPGISMYIFRFGCLSSALRPAWVTTTEDNAFSAGLRCRYSRNFRGAVPCPSTMSRHKHIALLKQFDCRFGLFAVCDRND